MGWVWLSHLVETSTPLYGGEKKLKIDNLKSLNEGDSCNTSFLCITSHTGTHVDVPYHFFVTGNSIDQYQPQSWIFNHPKLLDVNINPGDLIYPHHISSQLTPYDVIDLILIRTGIESYINEEVYWKESPGLSPELAAYLVRSYHDLRAVGIDFISISSLLHREQGRNAHQTLLEKDVLIFEDMALSEVGKRETLLKVIALPLRFEKGDGSPCTIIGWIDDKEIT